MPLWELGDLGKRLGDPSGVKSKEGSFEKTRLCLAGRLADTSPGYRPGNSPVDSATAPLGPDSVTNNICQET